MLKDFIWNTFEYTGNIDNYLFFHELDNHNTNVSYEQNKAQDEIAISMKENNGKP